MSQITVSSEQLDKLRLSLQRPSEGSSRTHLPTILPLAFPTPLHTLNILVSIHIIHAILSHPTHAAYFAETGSDPKDTAVMGVMGLYLSSSEDWSSQNLLSAAAWKEGKMNDSLVSEMFRIETTREAEHETLKGIRVGGRWDPGAKLVEDLVGFFKGSPGVMGRIKCVGEWVQMVIEDSWKEGEDVRGFVENCCNWAVSSCPILADFYATSKDASTLPFAPLRLIYDLASRQDTSQDLGLRLPKPQELEDLSPLSLPLSPLLTAGVLAIPDLPLSTMHNESLTTSRGVQRLDVESSQYKELLQQSVEVSRSLRASLQGWSYLDILLAMEELEKQEAGAKQG